MNKAKRFPVVDYGNLGNRRNSASFNSKPNQGGSGPPKNDENENIQILFVYLFIYLFIY